MGEDAPEDIPKGYGPTQQRPPRPPLPVIFLILFWVFSAFAALAMLLFTDLFFYTIIGIGSFLLAASIMKGRGWAFWASALLCALTFGVALLQVQFSGVYSTTSQTVDKIRFGYALLAMLCHAPRSTREWFLIPGTKKHRVTFWLLIGFFVLLGQFLLPILKAIGNSLRN